MIMKKINDRIYEFWNLDYIDDPKLEHPEDVDVLLEKEFPMSVEAFFFILSSSLNQLSVDEAESIGLI
jgi:hypothetical protein